MRTTTTPRARKQAQPGTQRFRWVAGWVDNARDADEVCRILRGIPGFLLVKREGAEPLFGIYIEADVSDERNTRHMTGIAEGVIRTIEWQPLVDLTPHIPKTREFKSARGLYGRQADPRDPPSPDDRLKLTRPRRKKLARKTSRRSKSHADRRTRKG